VPVRKETEGSAVTATAVATRRRRSSVRLATRHAPTVVQNTAAPGPLTATIGTTGAIAVTAKATTGRSRPATSSTHGSAATARQASTSGVRGPSATPSSTATPAKAAQTRAAVAAAGLVSARSAATGASVPTGGC
jgi:hypothetical protein